MCANFRWTKNRSLNCLAKSHGHKRLVKPGFFEAVLGIAAAHDLDREICTLGRKRLHKSRAVNLQRRRSGLKHLAGLIPETEDFLFDQFGHAVQDLLDCGIR